MPRKCGGGGGSGCDASRSNRGTWLLTVVSDEEAGNGYDDGDSGADKTERNARG